MNTRRDFLQKLGVSALMLQLSSLSVIADAPGQDEQPYQGRVLRVAIMGLGGYGSRVAEAMKACSKGEAGRTHQWNAFQGKRMAAEVQHSGKELL